MVDKVSPRQQQILELLLHNQAGLSIDEIAQALTISRNAVQQHFSSLERDGYIQAGALNKTAGRPVRKYLLTKAGINCFPKQYAWFSELVLNDLEQKMGAEGFKEFLHNLAHSLAKDLSSDFADKSLQQRLQRLIAIMDELGYRAELSADNTTNTQYIEACNCIYHDLAQKHQVICEFDNILISTLLNKNVELVECMAKGGHLCRFKIQN